MPVEITRIESGLYLNRWHGQVTLAEVMQAEQDGLQMLQPDETRVVLVNDLSAASKFPMDIKALRRIAETNPHVVALLVVDAPSMIRMVGEAQAKSLSWIVEFHDTLDTALTRGHEILSSPTPNP